MPQESGPWGGDGIPQPVGVHKVPSGVHGLHVNKCVSQMSGAARTRASPHARFCTHVSIACECCCSLPRRPRRRMGTLIGVAGVDGSVIAVKMPTPPGSESFDAAETHHAHPVATSAGTAP